MSNRARKYMTANNIDNFILTLSEHGILALDKKNHFHFETEHRDIADVSGAGDTVISIATLCLCAKLDIKQTAYVSNIAGGLVCERSGVVPIDLELLKQELTQ
jgi:bifunctional ADP-heptose synthase (sugar kinase/adenylyltransferase)